MRSSTMAINRNGGPPGRPQQTPAEPSSGPWWRHGMMWLVVGGPAAVVVAGIVTAVIAIRGADIVVDETGAPRGLSATQAEAYTPAMRARNHAATPKDTLPAVEPSKAPE